jgi:hypothetical protein
MFEKVRLEGSVRLALVVAVLSRASVLHYSDRIGIGKKIPNANHSTLS